MLAKNLLSTRGLGLLVISPKLGGLAFDRQQYVRRLDDGGKALHAIAWHPD